MYSPFANNYHRAGVDSTNPVLGGANSDGSSASDLSGVLPASPVDGLSGYSPFMGMPWGNNVPSYLSDAPPCSPLELPGSPMSPGLVFNPSPSPGGMGAPGSPRSLLGSHSTSPYSLHNGVGPLHMHSSFTGGNGAANMASAADVAAAAAAAAALNAQLPSFYYTAAAAAAGNAGSAANSFSLQAALGQSLLQQGAASLAAQQQQHQMQQQLLQASLSAALSGQANPYLQGYPSAVLSALEPMRSAGGSLSLDGGLQHQASVTAAAMLLQQQQQAAAQLRRNLSTPAAVAAQLGLGNAAAAAGAQLGLQHAHTLSANTSALSAQLGRLHMAHSADLTHLDAAHLLGASNAGALGGASARPKFKARKNSEPKIGPDGQPRLNARQRRTLRRAKERALKGLLEVSQALLQKAEVQVIVPNISHLTALEELAAVEAEKEMAGAAAANGGDSSCMSPGGSSRVAGSGCANGSSGGVKTRSQQLAAAAAAVEESVCEIARAAVAAVTAQATGKDKSSAAAAAQAAAAQAASAAASAGAVLPADYKLPEAEEPAHDDAGGLQPCNSDPLECLSHSAPTSPVGSSIAAAADPSSGRSSSSSSTSSFGVPASGRCSTSSNASTMSPFGAKPPLCQPARSAIISTVIAGSIGSPSPCPSPCNAGTAAGKGSQLEGIDIAGLIGQLSLKKDEGMVDDKLIRDLQIIQSLIGALKAPSSTTGVDTAVGGGFNSTSPAHGRGGRPAPGKPLPKRAHSYSPSSVAALLPCLPH
eukprot:GHRR01008316.1.p1 GENE.GHRR01008316.1~~GHRR01008316.1.p1  ORF type:complete len:760 (+),score=350.52 GHRR01008316.1:894-3173(+)